MRLALLALASCFPIAASAQVRTTDAPLAVAFSAGTAYVYEVGRAGPSAGLEIATRHLGFAAALAFPNDDFERAFGLSAVVYPGGRTAPVAVALGAEFDVIGGGGSAATLAGPVAAVSYRAVHTPDFSLVPEVSAGLLLPVGSSASQRNLSAQSAIAASVTLGGTLSPGVVTAVTPSVSRSSPLGSTYAQSAIAVGATASLVVDL